MSSERLSESSAQRRGSRSEGRLCSLLKPPYGLSKLETFKPSKVQSSDTSEDETTKDSKEVTGCSSSLKYEYRRDSSDSSDSQDTEKTKTSEQGFKNYKRVERVKNPNSLNKNKNYKKEATDKCHIYSELRFSIEKTRTDVSVDLFLDTNENNVKRISKNMSINKETKIDIVQA